MSRTVHDRLVDVVRRELKRHLKVTYCVVEDVYPHIDPYPDERDLNVVDIKLRDIHADDPSTYFKRVICLQFYFGNLWGHVWTPRKGDLVLALVMENEKAIVFGGIPNHWQEPPCRKHSTSSGCSADNAICYDYLFKWAKWRPPKWTDDGKPREHPPAQHPDCLRGFHDYRDWQLVFDCLNGHNDPWCKNCDSVDNVLDGCSWFKFLSDISNSKIFPKNRIQFHHLCGSSVFFENDGTVYLENRVDEDHPKAHIKMSPNGQVEIQSASAPSGRCCGCEPLSDISRGARIRVEPDGEILLDNLEAGAYIKITSAGEIILHSPSKITLDAPLVDVTGRMDVDDDLRVGEDLSIVGTCDRMYEPGW